MRYSTRRCRHLLTITILGMLLSACGDKRENTIISTTTPGAIYAHSVAFRNNSTFTWGANLNGQLGNGDTIADNTQYTPVQVIDPAATGMGGVSAGGTHTLAFVTGGNVYAWGNNGFGQLGNPSQGVSATPVMVVTGTGGTPLTGVTAVSAGFNHSLALDGNQHVWAWGDNQFGQLGNNTNNTGSIAGQVLDSTASAPLAQVTRIAAGSGHSLAVSNGNALSWGYNASGQLGRSNTASATLPGFVKVAAGGADLANVSEIAAGGSHSLFLLTGGTVWACGLNNFGQVGNGDTTNQTQGVVPVLSLNGVIAIAAGQNHSLAIVGAAGEVWAWGYNFFGQLGTPTNFKTTTAVTSPIKVQKKVGTTVSDLTDITKVVAIGHHSLAVDNNGKLWAWGDNSYGQLGIADKDTTNRQYATEVSGLASGAGL